MVRVITLTRQKFEYQLEPCKYSLRSCTDSRSPNISELEVQRRKLEVEGLKSSGESVKTEMQQA